MKKLLFDIDPYSFTGIAYLIGIILANQLNSEEQNSIANWLQLVGLTIQTYSSQVVVVSTNKSIGSSNNNVNDNTEFLLKIINTMKEEIEKIKNSVNSN